MSLKMITGIQPEWYTLASDETKETQFKVKPLTSAQRLDVAGINNTGMLGQTILAAVKYAVVDFKGIKDQDGKELLFSTALLEQLPANVLAELSQQIMKVSSLSEEERKN